MSQNGAIGGFNLRHPKSRALLDYWMALRGARAAPYKSEITAEGLGRTLAGNVFIMERLGDGALRFRLAGSRLHDMFGIELRGMSGPTIMQTESRQQFRALVDECLAGAGVGVVRGVAEAGEDRLRLEIMLAPLRSDFDQLNRLIGCIFPLDRLQGDIAPAPRRCAIREARIFAPESPERRVAGFAEEQTPFAPEAGLTTIEGGERTSEPRRGHLRLVKD